MRYPSSGESTTTSADHSVRIARLFDVASVLGGGALIVFGSVLIGALLIAGGLVNAILRRISRVDTSLSWSPAAIFEVFARPLLMLALPIGALILVMVRGGGAVSYVLIGLGSLPFVLGAPNILLLNLAKRRLCGSEWCDELYVTRGFAGLWFGWFVFLLRGQTISLVRINITRGWRLLAAAPLSDVRIVALGPGGSNSELCVQVGNTTFTGKARYKQATSFFRQADERRASAAETGTQVARRAD